MSRNLRSFIREKKIECNDYVEVDIIPRTREQEMTVKGKRPKKTKVSEPKQKNLNDKNARRYLIQVGNGNFGEGDFHVTATYSAKNLPATVKEAEREIINYLRRVEYMRKKKGLSPLKYILVTEYRMSKSEEEKPIRIHHHIIMNGGLERDLVEDIWSRRKKKGEKKGERIGYINADRLQPNENGIEALCKYITKDPQGKKRWSSSRNLERPYSRNNDHKYSKKKIERLAKDPEHRAFFEKEYDQYEITSIEPIYNEETGWSFYLKMWKRKD